MSVAWLIEVLRVFVAAKTLFANKLSKLLIGLGTIKESLGLVTWVVALLFEDLWIS